MSSFIYFNHFHKRRLVVFPVKEIISYNGINKQTYSRTYIILFFGQSCEKLYCMYLIPLKICLLDSVHLCVKGIDQSTFQDVMHSTFDLVTEEAVLERLWATWERGAGGGEGAIRFESWARGLSKLLRGTEEERRAHCFAVYDLNSDGYITRDEMFLLLKCVSVLTSRAIINQQKCVLGESKKFQRLKLIHSGQALTYSWSENAANE